MTTLTKSEGTRAVGFPPTPSWTHYLILLKVTNPAARSFYEIEAAREGWASRELEREREEAERTLRLTASESDDGEG